MKGRATGDRARRGRGVANDRGSSFRGRFKAGVGGGTQAEPHLDASRTPAGTRSRAWPCPKARGGSMTRLRRTTTFSCDIAYSRSFTASRASHSDVWGVSTLVATRRAVENGALIEAKEASYG